LIEESIWILQKTNRNNYHLVLIGLRLNSINIGQSLNYPSIEKHVQNKLFNILIPIYKKHLLL